MEKLKKEHQILIVDDTPQNIQVLGQLLSEQGYKILVATNGLQALNAVEKKTPDLILLDINMPEMDGYETCRILKSQDNYSEIPVIFLTARTEAEDIVKAFQVGGADYITKPFNQTELLARVHLQLILKEKKTELKEANENNKQLVRILLHDLGNPIGAIKSIAQLAEINPLIYQEMGHLIIKATNNCISILDSVRKMYSIDDNKYIPELINANLEKTIQSALFIFKHKLEEKNIKLNLNIPKELNVQIDINSFVHSVFNNLITNAIKFSYPDSSITINAYPNKQEVILSIRDYGMGMPNQILNNIFDVGKPTSRAGTNGEKGTGYGMPLVKKFVELFDGKITIQSKEKPSEDHGTEVFLYLKASV
ncbi:MAG: hybrid sensor histidine kinase/response regulator [Leptospiraceae bacterium]|nr:hybrid sensor histidine kinase/response regulator [Leptospiraceae bacterium]